MTHIPRCSPEELARETALIVAALQRAVRETLIDHKRTGDPIVICEGNTPRWLPAEEIEIPELPDEPELPGDLSSGRP